MTDLISATPADTPGTAQPARSLHAVCNPMIRLLALNKVFHTSTGSTTVLKDVNLEVKSGQIFGIIGASALEEHIDSLR